MRLGFLPPVRSHVYVILWLSTCASERLYVPCLCADILSNGCAVSVCLRARASVFAYRCACVSVFVSLCVGVGCRSVCLKKACAVVRTFLRVCVSLYPCAAISPCLCRAVALCVAVSICLLCLCHFLSIPLVLHRCVGAYPCLGALASACVCVGVSVSLCLDACVPLCVSVCTCISIAFYANVSLDSCMFELLCLCARSRVSCLCLHLRLNETVCSRVRGRLSVGGGGVVSVSVVLCTCRGVWSCVVCGAFVCAFVWFCAICLRGVASLCGVPA